MLLLSLILVGVGILIHFAAWSVILVKFMRRYNAFVMGVNDFFYQETPDTPSDFNKVLDQTAILFADRYRIAMTAVDRGQQGAAVRDVNRGLEDLAVENNPALAVAQNLPRSLRKNNLAMAGLNILVNSIMQNKGGGNGGGNMVSTRQVKFDL